MGDLWRDLLIDNKLGLSQPCLCFDLDGSENINPSQDNLGRLLEFPPFHVSWVTEFQRLRDVQTELRVNRCLCCFLLGDSLRAGGDITHGNLLEGEKCHGYFTNPKDESNRMHKRFCIFVWKG